jgi:DNA repair protein RadA/Sms
MAKNASQYVCQSCGAAYPKWAGRCEACGSWNSLVEEQTQAGPPKGLNDVKAKGRSNRIDFVPLKSESDRVIPRRLSKIGEFDRTLGGGLVPGSATLVGGDPGIGKSTILLQVVCNLARSHRVAYISGEEAIDQVRLRAARLGLADAPCMLASETSIRDIVGAVDHKDAPDILIIDSIQTMYVDTLDSAPGTVAQVRTSAQELIRVAKKRDISVILVGHVTKEGTIAGPRVLEHMVDTVLYLEGDRGHQFRVLRGVKNRFGPTDEIGVFEMTEKGLMEVANPSALFLADRRDDMSGAAVFAGLEGTRPVLVEIQALVAPTAYGNPRRAVIGWDSGRLAMILAVLEARCGVAFGQNDVYLNVAGGFRITEPAADLAVAAALLSSLTGEPVPANCVAFGEIGLSGEVRRVSQPELRIKEAVKLGFTQAITPSIDKNRNSAASPLLRTTEIRQLTDLLPLFQTENGAATNERAAPPQKPRRVS